MRHICKMASVYTLTLGLANAGEACQIHACKGFAFSASRRPKQQSHRVQAREGGGGTHTSCLPPPSLSPSLCSKLGLPSNFCGCGSILSSAECLPRSPSVLQLPQGRVPREARDSEKLGTAHSCRAWRWEAENPALLPL